MARRKIKKVVKEDLNEPDQFITYTEKAWQQVSKYRRPLLAGGGVILFVVLTVIIVSNIIESSKQSSTQLLADALEAYNAPVVAQDEITVLEKRGIDAYASLNDRTGAALKSYDEFLEKKKSSDLGPLGMLGKASALVDQEKHQEAGDLYREFLKSGIGDEYLKALAVDGLAYCLEAAGNNDDAIKELEHLAPSFEGYAKDMVEYHIGRLYQLKGEKAKARDLFAGILERLRSATLAPGQAFFLKNQTQARLLQVDPNAEIATPPRSMSEGLGDRIPADVMKQLQEALQRTAPENTAPVKPPVQTGLPSDTAAPETGEAAETAEAPGAGEEIE